ncbi:hypothetical protein PC129_g5265 [Phytophthora cactorum]|uniref:IQ motif, EF-hand binding site n=1 Tax=Phytophthora cactorum TaxID=29920 RepID=A0A329S669_9STRA|nr:hypothetical protein Pcac1_g27930 [Phytophthora cactorum]KAG2825096.1 hypothetical protein PC112_g9838 [Phytophthora cactorum]KAG2827336.1 hypothetical protein PC111_g8623 [Phytophthora cactorum]KAG2858114.1 hypothetical protein PC113_g10095 [Phytophthora cactorum]KAG2916794.1 hypothetical protein PC114_g7373 [Phytophthora cactorum]
MDRTPPAANGSSTRPKITTSTTSSLLRRTAPVSPSTTSPKFPPINKAKKTTSPKKPLRSGIYGKGVSLPKVSSVTFASGNAIQELDSGEELEVLKCILVREGYLQRLGRASAAGHIGGAHLGETIDVLDLLRLATLETVEAIVAWRGYKQKNKANDKLRSQVVEPEQFKWNGINYLLKLASDLGFLGKHTGLIEWLGFTLQRNPFILPLNLDCRAKLLQNSQPTGKTDSADSDRFLQVGGKRSRSTLGNSRSSNGGEDAETLAQALAERKRAKTPYEIRVVNDEELVPNSLSKTGAVRPKTRTPLKAVKAKYSSVLPSQIGEVDMARLHEAEIVVLQEEAAFGRYTRDIHGRVVPEDEALRRFSMVELSGNVYNVPATLKSSYAAEDPEGNELRLGDPSHSDIPGKFHAKKRSGMLGPIFKPEWRSFERPPPPRRRARGAQLEETLAAERKANAQLGVLLDLLREETERKAMDVAYFESCAELQGYSEELRAFTTQAQRELVILWKDLQEKKYMYENKIANIHKKEELLNTFKVQHQAVKDATHAERIESSRTNVVSRNQEQQRREDQEQAAVRTAAAAERHEHEQATPVVEHFCATQIQKIVRGMLARELFAQMKIEFVVASTFIQAAVRGFLVRRRVAKMYWHNAASVHIQRVARGFIARKLATEKRRRRLEIQSAERIQKVVRGRFGRVRMTKIRELVSWRLQLALAARSMNAVALQELANACQAMVALPNLMRTEAKATSEEKPLPALVLGLVRVLMIFTSDADNEWDIPNTRWRVAARFLRCGVGVTRRMQKIADAAAGAARAWMSPSGGFAAAGVAASTPYLRESVLGTALLDACKGDLDFRVDTFERIPRGWQAAVAIFKWTTAFCAISRLQHLVESSTNDLFLVVSRTLSKREAQHELTERRDADHSDEMLARRFVPVELVQTHGYPFHRPRPLLLVVANDVPRKARAVILEKLQVALPGLFLTITRPPATAKRSLGVQDPSQTFDFKTIRDALALGHSVILEGDVGLRGVTQRAFLSSFATVKHGLHPVPMCVLLRGTITNRSDLFGPKQGSDMEEEAYREEIVRRMVDADFKLALDRTTRLRLELADDSITHEMEEQAKSGDLFPAPSPALVVVMEAVLVLLTPVKVYEGPSQSEIATSSVSWRLSRRLLAQPAFLRAKLQQVDVTTIPPVNLVALERYLRHSWWPNAAVSRSQVDSSRLLYALAAWVESATRTARLIAADGTGVLTPEITRFGPVPGLFERVVVFNNCPTDSVQDGAGEDSAVMELMDAVLADVRVYRTAHLLVSSRGNVSTRKRTKKTNDEEARCVVTLFHECRRIFARVYSPSTGQRWMTVISEDDIDNLLTPTARGTRADKLPPKSHAEMYARLARLCLLQKRKFEGYPESIESPSQYELVLRPHAIRLYRHVLQLGGYLTTVTIAELSRGHVKVDAFVHGCSSQTSFTQTVALTLAVELESLLGRLSAAQARRAFVPASRIPSVMLDRLHLYCITRTQMTIPEFQQKLGECSLRLSMKTSEKAPGRVLLRRAVRIPGAASGERLVFTLVQRHEDGEFQAAFYAPRSSTRHTVRLPRDVAEELLHLPRHATPSKLQHVLLRRFCLVKPMPRAHDDSVEDSDGGDQELLEEADTMTCYRLRRRVIARFPCVLRVMEDIHQRVHKKQVIRAYVQVELCDGEDSDNRSTDAIRYRLWLPGSCLEQTLLLQESEIEASLPVELSWKHSTGREWRDVSRDIVRRYFQWDPNGGSGENGSVVAHLPYGSFWATEVVDIYKKPIGQTSSDDQLETTEQQSLRPRAKHKSDGSTEVSVVSCTCMLDDRDAESDDDDDDGEETELQRKTYSYDTEELVHRGSYLVNGLYVVLRVTMRAQVLRDLQPALVSPTDRVRERDSFTIKFCVYHPASSGATVAEIHGHRDLREVVGPDKSALISSTSLDTLMRHIILTRLDAQVDHEASDRLEVTFLRDRLYAKQKATPVTKMFERDSGVNTVKLIDEARRHGIAGERGIKVLTTAKVVSGCGRTLFTVFDIAASHRFGQDQSFVRLRVDAYVCATSARLSLLLEGSDLVHVVGDEDQELLLPIAHNDANTAEVAEMEEDRSRRLAIKVLDHLRVEQRSDGRGDRLVLTDFSFSMPHHDEAKTVRLFKTIRVVGHDQVLLSVYLDEGSEASSLSLRLELYDPASSSRYTLKLSHSTLSAILGIPASLELDQVVNEILKESDRANLMTHICSLLHVEKVSATSDGVLDRPSAFTMSLLFDEQRALECMRQHINHSGGIAADTEALPQCSWTGVTTSTDGKYLSVHLQLQSTQKDQRWLVCSAFAPAELLVSARKFEWVDIPAELLPILSENTETNDQLTSSVYSLFFSKVCEQLRLEVQYHDEGGHESEQEIQENHSARPKAISINFG